MTSVRSSVRSLFVLLPAVLGLAACIEVTDPDPEDGLDGTWSVTQINGQPLTGNGYAIPLDLESRSIKSGFMLFTTWSNFDGEHEGYVTAGFVLARPDGSLIPSKQLYSGNFSYAVGLPVVEVRAFGRATLGSRSGNAMTFNGEVPLKSPLGTVTIPVTLGLTRN